MSITKKKQHLYPLHLVIGFGILILFWLLPPVDPITPLGMRCVGAFLSMIYLWSTVETLWPSMVGLFALGISGYGGEGGFNGVWMNAIGADTVLLTLFAMVLMGGLDAVGDTKYIARWFLTRTIFKGRPTIFLATYFVLCFVLAALTQPMISLLLLWPISKSVMETLGVEKEDRVWKYFFMGIFAVSSLAQPLFPFKGAELIPYAAFQKMTASMGNPMTIPMLPYMAVCFTVTVIFTILYLLVIKYVLRVDLSKLKSIDPAMLEQYLQLPPMNKRQVLYLVMLPCFLLMILVPSVVKGNIICSALSTIGPLGVSLLWIMLFLILRIDGEPVLNFKEVAYRKFDWGIFFMIAAAVYSANSLSDEATGVPTFLVQVLTPILGGHSEMGFVAIMFTFALVLTNFANNAAMAVVLMPVVLNFSQQMGINPMPVATGVILMVFVAMLTPAASPHAGMMFGMKNIYEKKDVYAIGIPVCIVVLLLYIFVGYPLAKLLMV